MYRSLALFFASALAVSAADLPEAEISNGLIHAEIYLPSAKEGFYRGTRFDWSGVIHSLQAGGHDYYGPWFDKTDPAVHDFVYRNREIVAGPCSATTGPADEFGPVGYEEAKAGGTFIKIGIGALRKPADEKYDNYHLYEIANPGSWLVRRHPNSIDFSQRLDDPNSGYGYVYQKSIKLTDNKSQMVLTHTLKNTGKHKIQTNVYNHNFLVLDRQAPGAGVVISVPFAIQTSRPPNKELAEISGSEIRYLKTLQGEDVVSTLLEGFGANAGDSLIRIENKLTGVGMTIQSDRPLARESLWSIRSVLAMEPYVSISIEPGAEFAWTTIYEYYAKH